MTRICPRCLAEFEPNVNLCPDCQVQLTEKRAGEPLSLRTSDTEGPLVQVGSAPNEVVAKIWMQILEESGIRSVMQSVRPMSGLLGDFSFNLPCDIYVLESQADKAAEIIESLVEEDGNPPDEET